MGVHAVDRVIRVWDLPAVSELVDERVREGGGGESGQVFEMRARWREKLCVSLRAHTHTASNRRRKLASDEYNQHGGATGLEDGQP